MALSPAIALSSAGIAPVSLLKEKNNFKRKLLQVISEFERQAGGTAPPDYVGDQRANPLEHVTRRHVIDHMLAGLGWDLTRMNEEVIEEARARGETTLFLDYLGVSQQTRIPRLIVGAKAWAKPFVDVSASGAEAVGARIPLPSAIQRLSPSEVAGARIAAAIMHIKAGDGANESPVTKEWTEWLTALRDYVVTIHTESGHIVGRVAISSGKWIVIFADPAATFLNKGEVPSGTICVFVGPEIIERSDEIFDLLARDLIKTEVSELVRPARVAAYTSVQDIARTYRALWITRGSQGAHFQLRPQLILNVALVIERQDGVLLTIIDEQLRHSAVPHDYDALPAHIEEITCLSDQLLEATGHELGSQLLVSPVTEFRGFPKPGHSSDRLLPRVQSGSFHLLNPWRHKADEFLLVVGDHPHFLRGKPEIQSCGFHDWTACRAQQQSQGLSPIITRSVDPAAFFYSGEVHHCAHRAVHDRRHERCQIDAFEEYLCCRACTLQSFCWDSRDLARLPCGEVPGPDENSAAARAHEPSATTA